MVGNASRVAYQSKSLNAADVFAQRSGHLVFTSSSMSTAEVAADPPQSELARKDFFGPSSPSNESNVSYKMDMVDSSVGEATEPWKPKRESSASNVAKEHNRSYNEKGGSKRKYAEALEAEIEEPVTKHPRFGLR